MNTHVGKINKEKNLQLDGISDQIVADEAAKTCNLTKHDDNSTEEDEVDQKANKRAF